MLLMHVLFLLQSRILLCNTLTCLNAFADPDEYIPERWMRSADGSRTCECWWMKGRRGMDLGVRVLNTKLE